jgi:AcrR family transcriptional regulator
MPERTVKRPSPRERLLAASDELFYRDGVHSTGIDAVIEKAGVAKGSLYYIFGGKDELVAAYLRCRHDAWRQRVEAVQAGIEDPDAKILAIFDAIAEDVSRPDFRGCPFNNAAAEAPAGDAQRPLRRSFGYRRNGRHSARQGTDSQTHRPADPGSRESFRLRLRST